MNDNNTTTINAKETTTVIHGEYHGRYAACSAQVYEFLTKQYDCPKAVAHKVGHQVACDIGAAMKSERATSEAKHTVGKATKEGTLNLREALNTTVKGVSQTYPLRLAHAVQWINDAGKHYVSYGNTEWMLDEATDKWLTAEIEEYNKSLIPPAEQK
jgi:hypothetical protein